MKRVLFGLAVLALSAMVMPQQARAIDVTKTTSNCAGPTGFQVCASMTAHVVGVAGNWTLTLTVTNLYPGMGVSHAIFAAGIGTSQSFAANSWSLLTAKINGTSVTWAKASGNNNLIGGQLDLFAQRQGGGSGSKVFGGQTLELVFSSTSNTVLDLNDSQLSMGWHSGEWNGSNCSIWANTNGQFVSDDYNGPGDCGTNVVPEPITMLLLGTGLAGMGGFGALRRRRKGLDIENA